MADNKVTMRTQFADHLISKLPKPTKAQTEAVRQNFKAGMRCKICGGWHHPDVIHLDYVGHAALTDRLLDVDPNWSWEPLAIDKETGLPVIDKDGGLWIRLTVDGVTRLGYGDAQGKTGGDAMKERIGDALRNAAMRFGAALDLWHKGQLHLDDEPVNHEEENDFSGESLEKLTLIVKTVKKFDKDYVSAATYLNDQELDSKEKVWVWNRLSKTTHEGIKHAITLLDVPQ